METGNPNIFPSFVTFLFLACYPQHKGPTIKNSIRLKKKKEIAMQKHQSFSGFAVLSPSSVPCLLLIWLRIVSLCRCESPSIHLLSLFPMFPIPFIQSTYLIIRRWIFYLLALDEKRRHGCSRCVQVLWILLPL